MRLLKVTGFTFFLTLAMAAGSLPADAFVYQERVALSKSIAHYMMGHIYDMNGQPQKAVFEYQKSIQFDEANYMAHLRLGADYARLNMLKEAKEELKMAHQYNEEDLQSHYLLALIHSTQGDYESAANEYEIILKKFSKVEPANIEIYGYLGQLYYSQRKYDKAIEQFSKIIELEPENADVMYLLGSLYLEVNKSDRAIELLKQSIEIDPNHDGSLNTLGYVYAEDPAKVDEAKTLIERALKLSPQNGAYIDSLGWVYYQKGQYEMALEKFQEADALLMDPVIYEHLGDTYFKLNRFEDAAKYWTLSLKLQPGQVQVLNKLNELKNIQASR